MSSLVFSDEFTSVEVGGVERLRIDVRLRDWVAEQIVGGGRSPASVGDVFGRTFAKPAELANWFNVPTNLVQLKGAVYDAGSFVANVVLSRGTDTLRLFARIHGGCESHAYVETSNRPWFAALIRSALAEGLLPANSGFGNLPTVIETTRDSPLVLSCSTSGIFPFPLDPRELETLRRSAATLEMKPSNWRSFRFAPLELRPA